MILIMRNTGLLAFLLASNNMVSTGAQSTQRGVIAVASQDQSRKIELVNESGKNLVVDWINPVTGEQVPLDVDIPNGAKQVLDSFVNHTLLIHEPTYSPSCMVSDDDCGIVTVSDSTQQVAIVKKDLKVSLHDMATRTLAEAKSVVSGCKQAADRDLKDGNDPKVVMSDLAACLERSAAKLIQHKNEEIAFESKIRLEISAGMENHTCADPTRETSTPEEIRSWSHEDTPGNIVTRQVGILHDRPASQIHALENFISKEECDAITAAGAKDLHRGTVADGAGGHKLSEHRRAWQAAIPWHRRSERDVIAQLVRRIYDYTNDVMHYNLTFDGQEDLMSIQYFGIGKNSTESPDQYRPHCDGDCDGLLHKKGGRVATMVMYCDAPELGGGTNFQNSNIFVKPKVGSAAFFSYLNAETMMKETGFTLHSGCPVIEGTKRIAVHWMRHGVDAANPWDSFNTLTVKKGEEDL
jgi:2OG-Fe(II) oxygenase superfamily